MKQTLIALAAVLLLASVQSLGLKQHQDLKTIFHKQVQHESQQTKHAQAEAIIGALASEAAKKLIENPYQAAQIPTQFVQGGIDGMKGLFEGAWSLKDRSRSLQLTFVNLCKNDVVIEDTYFDSGTWYRSWTPEMKVATVTQGTVANRQGSWFTGVTGGMRLKIKNTNTYIYLGFNNPYIGGYKHYGELSTSYRAAKYGYDKSENNNPKNVYLNGYRLQVVQTPSDIAQMAFVYEISQA